jgi:hypothetical protein
MCRVEFAVLANFQNQTSVGARPWTAARKNVDPSNHNANSAPLRRATYIFYSRSWRQAPWQLSLFTPSLTIRIDGTI